VINILNYKREPNGKASGESVMRGDSPLANPYRVKPWGEYERGETLPLYKEWLEYNYLNDPIVYNEVHRLYDKWRKESSLSLVCCCWPLACHTEILRDFIYKLALLDTLLEGEK
jgi:hypothetical protein